MSIKEFFQKYIYNIIYLYIIKPFIYTYMYMYIFVENIMLIQREQMYIDSFFCNNYTFR